MRLFNLGFPKSGTSSLNELLDTSNIVSSHWEVNKKESGDAKKKKFVGNVIYSNYFSNKKVFEGFKDTQAITQADVCLPQQGLNYWPQFDPNILHSIRRDYPDCKFILLKRNPKKIIYSIKKWNDMYFRFVVSEIPGLPSWKGLEDNEILLWIVNHFNSIEERYKNDNLFLSIDLEEKTSFQKFCEFMEINNENLEYKSWPFKNNSPIQNEYSAQNYWLVKDLMNSLKSENKSKEMINGMNYKLKNLESNLEEYENKTSLLKGDLEKKDKEIDEYKKTLESNLKDYENKTSLLKGDLEKKDKEIGDYKKNIDQLIINKEQIEIKLIDLERRLEYMDAIKDENQKSIKFIKEKEDKIRILKEGLQKVYKISNRNL